MGEIDELGNLVVGVTTLGDVESGGMKPAQLLGQVNRLLDAGCIPATLVGVVLLPACEPGLANGDGLSAVSC